MEHNEATHEKMYELLMHAASQIRKKLAIDDLSYRVQLSPTTDSKRYFLHNVLNEFDKAVFGLMFACGFLADNRNAAQPQEIDKPMSSKIFQTKRDELGGVDAIAKKAHVGRESLYKTLSGAENPK